MSAPDDICESTPRLQQALSTRQSDCEAERCLQQAFIDIVFQTYICLFEGHRDEIIRYTSCSFEF